MRIEIQTIPHGEQRYPTVGDYWDGDDALQVRVSEMHDWRYVILVAVHEIVEAMLARYRGISESAIGAFDQAFEKKREQGLVRGEPGDAPDAPYRREHFFATNLERLLAAELGVDWEIYEGYVDSLGIKP
ncbi:MAG TPA: hypothetical protein VGH97_06310 [Thermoanaerobaculia bacterium]|jgi:hypothetical protein